MVKARQIVPVSRAHRVGELVSAIWEETEALFEFKQKERQPVVADVLNDLSTRSDDARQDDDSQDAGNAASVNFRK